MRYRIIENTDAVESPLRYCAQEVLQLKLFSKSMRCRNERQWLCMAEKWKHGDSSRDYDGNIEKALSRIKAKTVVIAFKEDMFIPVRDCQDEQEKINNSELVIIDSLWGHFTMMGIDENDFKAINQTIEKLLACD